MRKNKYNIFICLFVSAFLVSFRSNIGFLRSKQVAGNKVQQFVFVPALSPFTSKDFYVSKFEMKNVGGVAFSVPDSTPWVNINRADAIAKCRELGSGYDLITNMQWQTIANHIANQGRNWSSGVVGDGEINRGHSDNVPTRLLAASRDDLSGNCEATGQVCSSNVWNSQRRTHFIDSTNLIWDFSGNAYELTNDLNSSSQGSNAYVSKFLANENRQFKFGSIVSCNDKDMSPFCGFGFGAVGYSSGGVWRGGHYADLDRAGLFAVRLNVQTVLTTSYTGFRCVFNL